MSTRICKTLLDINDCQIDSEHWVLFVKFSKRYNFFNQVKLGEQIVDIARDYYPKLVALFLEPGKNKSYLNEFPDIDGIIRYARETDYKPSLLDVPATNMDKMLESLRKTMKRFSKKAFIEMLLGREKYLRETWGFIPNQGNSQLGRQFDRWLSSELSNFERTQAHLKGEDKDNYLFGQYLKAEAIAYGQWAETEYWLMFLDS